MSNHHETLKKIANTPGVPPPIYDKHVLAHGMMKSGNYALQKACKLLGVNTEITHIWIVPEEVTHQIFLKRDPRHVLMSYLRWKHIPVTAKNFLERYKDLKDETRHKFVLTEETKNGFVGMSFPDILKLYERHLTGDHLIVSYEDLVSSDREIRRIAEYLGKPYKDGLFEQIEGGTRTWEPVHSNYLSIWNSDVERDWDALGGNELLKRWGYA